MRDPARINRVLKLLEEYWNENPDLRLGQIVMNLHPDQGKCQCSHNDRCRYCNINPYHVEDTEWEAVLRAELAK